LQAYFGQFFQLMISQAWLSSLIFPDRLDAGRDDLKKPDS